MHDIRVFNLCKKILEMQPYGKSGIMSCILSWVISICKQWDNYKHVCSIRSLWSKEVLCKIGELPSPVDGVAVPVVLCST